VRGGLLVILPAESVLVSTTGYQGSQYLLRSALYFLNAPHINNRPLKSSLSYPKLKLNSRVGRWRKPVLISRWPVVRFAES
jgi:hypothetical protein